MDFSLNDDQRMIRDAAQDYLADNCASEAVRAAMTREEGYDPTVWQAISADLGWCCVPIAEEHGGMGLGPVEVALIQEQAGYHLLPSPFFPTVCLAANVLAEVGSDAICSELLPGIAGGEITASVANSAAMTGKARFPSAGADAVLLVLTEEGLFRLTDPESPARLEGWDASRRFIEIDLGQCEAERVDEPSRLAEGRTRAIALSRLYLAAEQLGAAQRCLDLTVAYVQERKQFGRAVGSFQAVKHRCAEMMVQIEATRSAVYGAAAMAAGGADESVLSMECAMAKAQASEALFWCAGEAIQLHGGVGFTEEYDPQLFFKRAQATRHYLGTPETLRAEIAEGLL